MTYLTALSLDDTHNPHIVEAKLKDSGRLDTIYYPMMRKIICIALGEYLREIKFDTTDVLIYYVTDDDLDNVVSMMQEGLSEYN